MKTSIIVKKINKNLVNYLHILICFNGLLALSLCSFYDFNCSIIKCKRLTDHQTPHNDDSIFKPCSLVSARCAECAGPSIMSANVVLSITWKHPRALNTRKMDGPRSCSRHICSSSLASSSFLHSSVQGPDDV